MDLLTVDITAEDDTTIVSLNGELDLSTTPLLNAAMDGAFEAHPAGVILDLSGLRFLDSHGIGTIIAGHARGEEAGVRLRLRNPTGMVKRVLEITGIGKVIAIDAG